MPTNRIASTRTRGRLIAATLFVPAVAAGAIWVRSAYAIDGSAQACERTTAAPQPAVVAGPSAAATPATASSPAADLGSDSGGVVITAPEELHTFMVAIRTPDGRIVLEQPAFPTARGSVRARRR